MKPELGDLRERIIVLGSLHQGSPLQLQVVQTLPKLQQLIPMLIERYPFLTLTFLGPQETAVSIQGLLAPYAQSGVAFFAPDLSNRENLLAFLLDGLTVPLDQRDALTSGMEEQGALGPQA